MAGSYCKLEGQGPGSLLSRFLFPVPAAAGPLNTKRRQNGNKSRTS